MLKLDSKEVGSLLKKGLSKSNLEEQLALLIGGVPKIQLVAPATIGKGIVELSADRVQALRQRYTSKQKALDIVKFVPASGAASRMFKDLVHFMKTKKANHLANRFYEDREKFPFWNDSLHSLSALQLVEHLLTSEGQAFLNKAKGSIPFHAYDNETRTAFSEHLIEGVQYAATASGVHIHFTLPSLKREDIERELTAYKHTFEERYNLQLRIDTSIQLSETDVLALNSSGEILRQENGEVVLRPGGHGSLIHNLNDVDADVVFIKNIDNIVPDSKRAVTIEYKEALAGLLLEIRSKARDYKIGLENGSIDPKTLTPFLQELGLVIDEELTVSQLVSLLSRPYRVCGMVLNEGEPGGGPFWVRTKRGDSLQIIESAQIDKEEANQQAISSDATHFNPVDLVCCTRDLEGKKINLTDYRDMTSSFVSSKMVEGNEIKILEWPGLWNGAMSDWNTVFVEVPLSTFNPVKTVNDLLRPMHQA